MNERYEALARNTSEKSYAIVEKALDQIRAYLALPPENLTESEIRVVALLGREIGESGKALEERIKALRYAGFFLDKN